MFTLGLLLVVLGAALMAAEAHVPSYGALGFGAVVGASPPASRCCSPRPAAPRSWPSSARLAAALVGRRCSCASWCARARPRAGCARATRSSAASGIARGAGLRVRRRRAVARPSVGPRGRGPARARRSRRGRARQRADTDRPPGREMGGGAMIEAAARRDHRDPGRGLRPGRRVGPRTARVRARGGLPARPDDRHQRPRARPARPRDRPHGARLAADGDAQRPAAGRHHARQRHRPRRRRRLLPRRRPQRRRRPGRELPQGDVADRADDAALRARQGRPGHAAVRARAAQRGAAEDHRRADRAVGRQGLDRRDQGRRHPGRRCSTRWPARRRPSASGGRRSSTPRASSRPRRA